jgi:multidrug efflux system membrane fusion protein
LRKRLLVSNSIKEEAMKKNTIWFMVSIGFLCLTTCTEKKETKSTPPVRVKVAPALQKDVPIEVKAIGNIEASVSVAVKSQVSGQIARVHFKEGSDVRKGDLLFSLDPEPFLATLRQCEAALARDQAQANFAREQANRYEGLFRDGIVTQDQYGLLRTNAESFAATVAADLAAIHSANIQLGYCSIRSPVSGRTGTLSLHPGNLTKANDVPLVTIEQVRPIHAVFSLPEKWLAELKRAIAGNTVTIEAVLPNEPGGTESGTISFLDSAVNPATGTIRLKGVFANRSGKLWPGQFAEVVMTLGHRRNSVVVPTQAVQTGQQGPYVYVVKSDRKVEMRPVTTGAAAGEETVVEKGLATGETVVLDGQLRLTPGATVTTTDKEPAGSTKR